MRYILTFFCVTHVYVYVNAYNSKRRKSDEENKIKICWIRFSTLVLTSQKRRKNVKKCINVQINYNSFWLHFYTLFLWIKFKILILKLNWVYDIKAIWQLFYARPQYWNYESAFCIYSCYKFPWITIYNVIEVNIISNSHRFLLNFFFLVFN